MAARIDHGRAQLLTATGLDWSDKYPSIVAALANVKAKTAYLDGELCGVDDAGLRALPILDNDCWACVRAPATCACSLKGEWLKHRVINLRYGSRRRRSGLSERRPALRSYCRTAAPLASRAGGKADLTRCWPPNLPAWLLEEAATSS
jgi:hypothetical protein